MTPRFVGWGRRLKSQEPSANLRESAVLQINGLQSHLQTAKRSNRHNDPPRFECENPALVATRTGLVLAGFVIERLNHGVYYIKTLLPAIRYFGVGCFDLFKVAS